LLNNLILRSKNINPLTASNINKQFDAQIYQYLKG